MEADIVVAVEETEARGDEWEGLGTPGGVVGIEGILPAS